MKIACVGKGGSGKTTISALLSLYSSVSHPVFAFDADINMHLGALLSPKGNVELSKPKTTQLIKTYLRGSNHRIKTNDTFKKTTPPGLGSKIIRLKTQDDYFINNFTQNVSNNLNIATLGTYGSDGVGKSCYHNNLALAENILSHLDDSGIIIVDMVAGSDAFAGSMFAQFDLIVVVAEPTMRSVEVVKQFSVLAQSHPSTSPWVVVGNKIENTIDKYFLKTHLLSNQIVANIPLLASIKRIDKYGGTLTIEDCREVAQQLADIIAYAQTESTSSQTRLSRLWDLHKAYVAQQFVTKQFGDLSSQIDTQFMY